MSSKITSQVVVDPSWPPSKRCPICGRVAAPAVSPFCSQRCADVDLHRWLGGVYAVPIEDETPAFEADQDE